MSISGWRDAIVASAVEPSANVTLTADASPTTWSAVRIVPESLTTTPVPIALVSPAGSGSASVLDQDDRGLDGGVDELAASRRRRLRGEDAGDDVADVTGGQGRRRRTDDAVERDRQEAWRSPRRRTARIDGPRTALHRGASANAETSMAAAAPSRRSSVSGSPCRVQEGTVQPPADGAFAGASSATLRGA